MAVDLSRRRFIIGAFAAVAGVAAAPAIQAAQFIPRPKLDWNDTIAFLRKSLEPRHIKVKDVSRLANNVALEWHKPHYGPGPKMLVGWDAMDWAKITAEQQQGSAEFIEDEMLRMVREHEQPISLAGREESLIRRDDLGLWAHADT